MNVKLATEQNLQRGQKSNLFKQTQVEWGKIIKNHFFLVFVNFILVKTLSITGKDNCNTIFSYLLYFVSGDVKAPEFDGFTHSSSYIHITVLV